jgi:hypothetical protein
MKKLRKLLPVFAIAISLFSTSCDRNNNPTTVDANEQQHSIDADRVKSESDQVVSDAESVLSATSVGRVSGTTGASLCGASVDTSLIAQKTITITYDGTTNCSGYVRSGSVQLKLVNGNRWRDAGAVVEITHTNYKVVRQADSKFITFNGVKYVTNLNGSMTLTRAYKERGANLNVTFDDNTQRNWSLARHWEVNITSLSPLAVNYTVTGDTTINGISNVMAWGTNRYNVSFTNSTPVAILMTNECGFNRPKSGKMVHTLSGKGTLTATAGVDASGNAVTSGCAYGYKLEWAGDNGSTASVIKPYK